MNHGLEWVLFAISADRHILGAVGAHDQDAMAGEAPPQVEEQADRAEVCPLQVVQYQEQWLPL